LGNVLLALEGRSVLAALSRFFHSRPSSADGGSAGECPGINFKRYHFQGIGRYEPADAYARGIADLDVLANLLAGRGYIFGAKPGSIDAALYGFIANIYFYDIDTPLKKFLLSRENLVAHCRSIHAAL
jgi:hypothetical protein